MTLTNGISLREEGYFFCHKSSKVFRNRLLTRKKWILIIERSTFTCKKWILINEKSTFTCKKWIFIIENPLL